jgi:hypothetical protein
MVEPVQMLLQAAARSEYMDSGLHARITAAHGYCPGATSVPPTIRASVTLAAARSSAATRWTAILRLRVSARITDRKQHVPCRKQGAAWSPLQHGLVHNILIHA